MVSFKAEEYDAIVVGAGFSGCFVLQELRKLGYKVCLLEAGTNLGGIWYWNCYPGARVDSDCPTYEFSDEELWKDWNWSERFPGWAELRKYFAYVDSKWNLKKDIKFNTRVTSADFDSEADLWVIRTDAGTTCRTHFFIPSLGWASKRYMPTYKGLGSFAGECHHTAAWPQDREIDFKGKRVGVIGTGASGVQVVQEVHKEIKHLTVFQRTPNLSLPMNQSKLDDTQDKSKYPEFFKLRKGKFDAMNTAMFHPKSAIDSTPEERREIYEKLWSKGAFNFWYANFYDTYLDPKANLYAYDFWQEKTSARIKDPKVAELLAPKKAPHFFGARRPSLEVSYFEAFNQDNVELVNLKAAPIDEITPTGVTTKDGVHREFDILVLATGFDAITGGLLLIDIHGMNEISLRDKWAAQTDATLGLMTAGFPNMFMPYGPLGVVQYSSAPPCAEVQGAWIARVIDYMMKKKMTFINPSDEIEADWKHTVDSACSPLIADADAWWNGSNVPGKRREVLSYFGGMPTYFKTLENTIANDFPGYEVR